ncbi:hypothetical protein Tco_1001992 [Tanacetum coccineum]|uniref:Uncharacterized protein n=1 Tax=Tanacetum coccineum TaxID=301880 RepID=A0ABQ5F664_9ASTR
MAYSSCSSNANSKLHTCSTECEQSYANLKKLYDTQREQLGDASIEIQAYTLALKKVEAQLSSTKEKEELKTKLEKWENSSKCLNKLLDSQLNANDKAGLGYDGAKESKVSETITSVSKVETSNSKTSNDKVEMPKNETVRMSEPIIEEWESDSKDDEILVKPKEVTKTVKPSFEKIESVNARNETIRKAENPRKNNKSPKGNKRNWNELAIPGQTATGKESSNPFMAGSLPKTIHFCDSLQSDEDSFELIELMILCTNFLNMVRDLENLKTTYLIIKKVWVRMHPNRGGLMMQKQRLPSLMRLQMMLETRTTRFQTAIRSEEVFGYILMVIKKLLMKKLND